MLINSFRKVSAVAGMVIPDSTEEEIILSFNEFGVALLERYSHEL